MSATILVSGKLVRDPTQKTSKAGKPFVSALLKEGDGEATTWWSILTFSETAIDEMLTLKAGDGMAASGSFKAELYERNGTQRISFTIFADRVISAKRQKRERPARQNPGPQAAPFDDEIPL